MGSFECGSNSSKTGNSTVTFSGNAATANSLGHLRVKCGFDVENNKAGKKQEMHVYNGSTELCGCSTSATGTSGSASSGWVDVPAGATLSVSVTCRGGKVTLVSVIGKIKNIYVEIGYTGTSGSFSSANSTMGSVSSASYSFGTDGFSSSASSTATANTGYHFTGWSGTNVSTSGSTATVYGYSANGNYTANFAANTYTVKVVTGGATSGKMDTPSLDASQVSSATKTLTYGQTYNLYHFDSLTRPGYKYAGVKMSGGDSNARWGYWDTSFGDGGSNNAPTALSNDTLFATDDGDLNFKNLTSTNGGTVTLTVQWTPIEYSIDVNLNGATGGSLNAPRWSFGSSQIVTSQYLYDNVANLYYFTNLERTGYVYAGLKMSGGGTTAMWGYYRDDGSDATNALSNDTLIGTDMSKGGDMNFKNLTTTDGGTVTLIVQWTPITYTLKVDKNGGTGNMSRPKDADNCEATLTYDKIENIWNFKTELSRTGYTYAGLKFSGAAPGALWNYYHAGQNGVTYGDGTGGSDVANKSIANDTLFAQDNGDVNFKNLATTQGAVVTVIVQWTPITYNVTIDYNGGSGTMRYHPANVDGVVFTTTTLTYDVPYNIYHFDDGSSRTGYLYDGVKMSGGGTTAKWGYWNSGQYVTGNALSNDTKFAESDGDLNFINLSETQGATVTLSVQWKPITYTVVYNGNKPDNATANVASVPGNATWTYDSNATLGGAPTLTGWTFGGWYKESGCTTLSGAAGASLTKPNYASTQGAAVTLYAKWTANTYTVKYNANKPSNATGTVSTLPADATWTYDSNETLGGALTLTGWTFGGWYKESGCTNLVGGGNASLTKPNLTSTQGATVTLYAKWTANTYTVKYNANKPENATASVASVPGSVTWTYDNNAMLGTAPTLTGWTFGGWYKESGCETLSGAAGATLTKPNYATTQGATVNLYAKWTANTYTVKYNANKPGNATGTVSTLPSDGTWTYDSNATLGSALTLTGWTFGGWYKESGCANSVGNAGATLAKPNLTSTQGATVTLYAKWTANTYTVRYNGNKPDKVSASVASVPGNATWTYDSNATLGSAPTLTGWTFGGWYKESGCATLSGAAGATLTKPNYATTEGTTVDLYAKWTANTYTVGYDFGGGTNGEKAPTAWTYDEAQEVSAPTRAGYVFIGYKVTSGLDAATAKWGTGVTPATAITSETNCFVAATSSVYFTNLNPADGESVTITAYWASEQYALSYDANGGTVSSASKAVSFATAVEALSTPTRTGYIFKGWSLVPTEYVQVEYIASSGSGYVLTDIVPKGTSSVRMAEMQTSLTGTQTYWVARGSGETEMYSLFYVNGKMRYDYGVAGGESFTPAVNTQYVISAERNRLWVDGTNAHTFEATEFTAGGPMMFLSSYSGGTGSNINNGSSMKLYGVTIWEEGVAVAYLTPCYRKSDGKIGLYDAIGNKFFAGTGTLTKGEESYVAPASEYAVGKNGTVYAVWQAKTYDVSLDDNFATATGNTAGTTSIVAEYDSYVPEGIVTPRKSGFEFLGYYIGETQYYDAAGTPKAIWRIDSEGMTLTAKWSINDLVLSVTDDFECEYNVGMKTLVASPTHGCEEIAYAFAWDYNNVKAHTLTVPTRLNVGTYEYSVTVYGTVGAYTTRTESATVTVTIVQKDISGNAKVVPSYNTFVYNGLARDGLRLLQDIEGTEVVDMTRGTDYSVEYENNTNAGTATVTIAGLGNYKGVKTGTFLITPKPLTVSSIVIDEIAAVTYKGSAYTPTVTVRSTAEPVAVLTLRVGETGDYTVSYSRNVNAGTATVTVTGHGNYGDSKTADFTINKAPLTVKADDKTTTYGENAPAFTASITGFVGGETRESLFDSSELYNGYACAYARGNDAGTYAITPTQGSLAASNYSFEFADGVLTVEKRGLTVTADDKTCVYGDAKPVFTVSCSAFYGTDTKESVLGGKVSVSCDYVQGSGVGTYTLTPVVDVLKNYAVTTVGNGTLTVTKKLLTLTATSFDIDYDEDAPTYGGTYSGFYGTDTEAVISGTPVYNCAYVKGDDSGAYEITVDVSGLIADNYSFVGVSGTLAVEKGVLTFTFAPITENGYDYVFNGRSKEITATLSGGMCRTDVLTGFTLKYYRQYVTESGVTYALDAVHKDAGVYKVVPENLIVNGSAIIQYEVDENSYGFMTVTQLQVVVLINELTVTYDGEPHGTSVSFTLGEGDRLSNSFTLLYDGSSNLPVNAGKYRVTILERDTANIVFEVGNQDNYKAFLYDVDKKYLEITKKAATVTPTGIEIIYGEAGTPGFTSTGILEQDGLPNCSYSYAGENYPESRTMPTALGTYTIGIRILSGDPILRNYDVTYGTSVMTISKRSLVLTADDLVRTYNGLHADGTVTVGGDGLLVAGTDHIATGDRVVPVFAYDGNQQAIDAGTYVITIASAQVIGKDDTVRDYYSFDLLISGTLTIEKAEISLIWTSSVVYNGRVRTYSSGNGDSGEPVWAYGSGLVGTDGFGGASFAYFDGHDQPCEVKNVGSYTVRVTNFTLTSGNKNNYTVLPGTLSVTPLSPVIAVRNKETVFNATCYAAETEYILGEGDAISFDLVYKKGNVTTKVGAEEAGEWTVEVDLSSITFTSGSASNYGTFGYEAGTLTVLKRELVVSIGTQRTTYNGNVQSVTATVTGWAENGERPTAAFTFAYIKNGVATEPLLVGTYDVEITSATITPEEQSVNYYFTFDVAGRLVIADRELTFSVDAQASAGTFEYDGTAKRPSDDKIIIGGQGLVEGDTLEYVYRYRLPGKEWQEEAVYAGHWEVVLIDVTFPGQDSHYSIPADLTSVRFFIDVARRDIVVSVKDKEEVFDGTDKIGEAVGSALVEGDEIVCDFSYPDGRKNVGTYRAIMSNVAILRNGKDITDSYNITVEAEGTITVTKCAFTVTVEEILSGTEGYIYDGTTKQGKVRSNIGKGDTFTYSLSYVRDGGTDTKHIDAGEWRVYLTSVAFGDGV
ncbi:MAG: InlB B-repeat-containing protein, partial [Clostridia bacterium]|nr:InlB B-repeat-containing protein [Clostridia bacterium]